MEFDLIVVGAGTAGLSAAIYGQRAGKRVLVLESNTYGGQIINTPEVENYPGIAHTSGYEFAQGLYDQAVGLGATVQIEAVTGVEDCGKEKIVHTTKGDYPCKAVILATGAKNRPLGLEHEKEWVGSGVSYCATCDGMFYRKKDVAVAGGGNTALEDALFLSNVCHHVYLVHRRDAFRGDQKTVDALRERDNVTFVLNANIVRLVGETGVEGVEVEDKNTGEKQVLPVSGCFVAIGQQPENGAFSDVVEIDSAGYIAAGEDCLTKTEGIFTAGDCRTKTVRQLTTAAADGAVAALAACNYIG